MAVKESTIITIECINYYRDYDIENAHKPKTNIMYCISWCLSIMFVHSPSDCLVSAKISKLLSFRIQGRSILREWIDYQGNQLSQFHF